MAADSETIRLTLPPPGYWFLVPDHAFTDSKQLLRFVPRFLRL